MRGGWQDHLHSLGDAEDEGMGGQLSIKPGPRRGLKRGPDEGFLTSSQKLSSMPSCLAVLRDERSNPALGIGSDVLDVFLGQGLRKGITELCGEAGAGKTQLALQWMLHVQMPAEVGGLDGAAVFVSTEGGLPTQRLEQMAQAYRIRYPFAAQHNFMDNIYTIKVATLEEQKHCLEVLLPQLLETKWAECNPSNESNGSSGSNFGKASGGQAEGGDWLSIAMADEHRAVRLVVVDSIAAIVRTEYDRDYGARAADAFHQAALLKRLSERYAAPVLCLNQVTDLFDEKARTTPHLRQWSVRSSNRNVVPALGMAWACCVNCRLFISRNSRGGGRAGGVAEGSQDPVLRKLHITFAPHLEPGWCQFVVDGVGVRGVPNSSAYKLSHGWPPPVVELQPANEANTDAYSVTEGPDKEEKAQEIVNAATTPQARVVARLHLRSTPLGMDTEVEAVAGRLVKPYSIEEEALHEFLPSPED